MWPDRACFGVPGQVMLALVFTQSLSISTKSRPQLHRLCASKAAVEVSVIFCVRTLWVFRSAAILLQVREPLWPEGCGPPTTGRHILQFRLRLWLGTLLSGPALPGLHSST